MRRAVAVVAAILAVASLLTACDPVCAIPGQHVENGRCV